MRGPQTHPNRVRTAPGSARNRGLINTPSESTELGVVPSGLDARGWLLDVLAAAVQRIAGQRDDMNGSITATASSSTSLAAVGTQKRPAGSLPTDTHTAPGSRDSSGVMRRCRRPAAGRRALWLSIGPSARVSSHLVETRLEPAHVMQVLGHPALIGQAELSQLY